MTDTIEILVQLDIQVPKTMSVFISHGNNNYNPAKYYIKYMKEYVAHLLQND